MSKLILLFGGLLIACLSLSANAAPLNPLLAPLSALTAKDIAIIANDADPMSLQIADYYQHRRGVPADQMIHIRFNPKTKVLSRLEFAVQKKRVDEKTPAHVQAFVLSWMQPYRVDCMSITTAFATGFDEAFCAKGCELTRKSPYFNSISSLPFRDYGLRPTMMLAGNSFEDVKALIDRGIAADFSQPKGSAYLLKTADKARSSRAVFFPKIAEGFKGVWPVFYMEKEFIKGQDDVMFYFTGLTQVPYINENRYPPGAIADHLTSAGGVLSGSKQMNILDWLKAGATASYGAVVEPCNFPPKFPHPGVLMANYLRGSSLIEAYWKSVGMPGQGVFVGEPLARPFAYPSK
ncbi:TIGR03790 family protein [Methylicorpusculum sp.]|uniref:TIGR03790 family protein n=1 Tax=Methylicorpusculum sp. TaxID=2713644 RepID=UPI00271C9F12|nr:TIGR03790 family protein [Methylicorpusculum sp.]MDO8842927.1 TIGR03790 family protein [Methylicorpusculum sp.]